MDLPSVFILLHLRFWLKINSDIIQSPVEHALVMWVRFLLNIDGIIKSGKKSTEIQRHLSINMLKLQFIVCKYDKSVSSSVAATVGDVYYLEKFGSLNLTPNIF